VAFKYGLMSQKDIERLPVQDLAAEDCALFLWSTFPQLPDCIKVLEAWGFQYKTAGFVWAKTNSDGCTFFMGMGSYTRSNAEVCLLGLKGRLKRQSGGVRSLVVAQRGRHSEKPEEVRDRIVQLYGDVPGWDAWGNEVPCSVELKNNHFVSLVPVDEKQSAS
jgi:N6-adenosine-specific RNA methylase IME4